MRSLGILVTCVTFTLGGCGDDDAPPGGDAGTDGAADAPSYDAPICDPATPPASCDFFSGCGCDVEGGQKCSVGPEAKRCAFAGTKGEWEACADDGECMPGTGCVVYPAGTTERHCLRFCDPGHACPTDEICFISIVNTSQEELGRACSELCNLLNQDCMFEGLNCHTSPSSVPTAETGVCVGVGPGMQGDECETQACAEGFNCITPSGSSTGICAKLCTRANGDADCSGLSGDPTCQELSGHTATGICLP